MLGSAFERDQSNQTQQQPHPHQDLDDSVHRGGAGLFDELGHKDGSGEG